MSDPLSSLDYGADVQAAIGRAAASAGLSTAEWLRSVIVERLRQDGYLGQRPEEALRPSELNANNDG